MQLMTKEDNPIIEIRAKLGYMTKWSNDHSTTARDLYKLILETLNLIDVVLKKNYNEKDDHFFCIDVPVDINGRHAVCDRARKMTFAG